MTLADNALKFDSSNTSHTVDVGSVDSLSLRGDYTIECWVKLARTEYQNIVTIVNRSALAGSATSVLCNLLQDGGPLNVSTALAISVWHHFAVRYTKSTGEFALYLNGTRIGARVTASPYAPSGTTRVKLSDPASNGFDGTITEVRFWSVARTDAEIRAYLFRHLDGREDGLSGYFPLDGLPGDTTTAARDAKVVLDPITLEPSASTRTPCTIAGAAFVPSDLPLQRTERGVVLPTCVVAEFTGTIGRINVPDAPSLSLGGPFTVEAWVRPTGKNGPVYMFPVASKHSAGKGWELRAGGGQAGFLVTIDGVYHEVRAPLENGAWHLISGVHANGVLALHVNGVLVANKSVPTGVCTQSPVDLVIGANAYWTDQRYAGQIAEVRIWNEARTPASLRESFMRASRLGEGEIPATLVALYRLQGDAKDARGQNDGIASDVFWSVAGPPLPPSSPEAIALAAAANPADSIAAQITANAARRAVIDQEKGAHDATRAALAALQSGIATRADEIAALTATEHGRATREDTLAARKARKAELEAEREALLNPPPLLLTNFMQKASDEVKRAREALTASGGRLRLDAVDLSVRMVPAIRPQGDLELRFPTVDELKALSSGGLSSLDLEIEAPPPANEEAAAIIVPSVVGYTETVARRKLGASSLRAEIAFQSVRLENGRAEGANRVVTQLPTPGAAVPKGSAITLFIGRES